MLSPHACQKIGISEHAGEQLLAALHREIIRLSFANKEPERIAAFKIVADWMEK